MLMLPWLVEWINGLLNELYGAVYKFFVSGICGSLAVVCVDV